MSTQLRRDTANKQWSCQQRARQATEELQSSFPDRDDVQRASDLVQIREDPEDTRTDQSGAHEAQDDPFGLGPRYAVAQVATCDQYTADQDAHGDEQAVCSDIKGTDGYCRE